MIECTVMYGDGPQPSDDEVMESLTSQIDDLGGELDADTLLIPPVGTTEEQFKRVFALIWEA